MQCATPFKPLRRYAWLGVAVAGVAVLLAINAYHPTPAVATDLPAMPVLARDLRLADRIQIVHQGAVLDLERRGQMWCLAQNGGYPVKQAMAQRLLDQLLALRFSHPNAAEHTQLRREDPKNPSATLTGIRVLATNGAGLGAIIVADHAPTDARFMAHQLGDPRDWEASGQLDAPVDRAAWIDSMILPVDSARLSGAGTPWGMLSQSDATARLTALQAMKFSDVRPVAQMLTPATAQVAFTLSDGGTLSVSIRAQPDQVWLEFHATTPGVTAIPEGDWVFRYPMDAAAVLLSP